MAKGEIRQTQLRHARRGLVPGPVPALDEQSVGHQDRRRALQGRRPGGAGARRQPGAVDPLRHRQFPRLGQSRQGQGHCRVGGETLVADVPTLAEAGLGGFPGQGWWGLAAPKGTPPAIVDKVNAAFVKVFSDPKFMAFLDQQAVGAGADLAGRFRRVPEGLSARPPRSWSRSPTPSARSTSRTRMSGAAKFLDHRRPPPRLSRGRQRAAAPVPARTRRQFGVVAAAIRRDLGSLLRRRLGHARLRPIRIDAAGDELAITARWRGVSWTRSASPARSASAPPTAR